MVAVRRRNVPKQLAVPVVELDKEKLAKIKVEPRPGSQQALQRASIEAVKARLASSLPQPDAEVNADGSSFKATVERYASKVKNPLTAIRAKCVDCCCGSLKEVTECKIVKCALHPFRMGKNPMHARSRTRLEAERELGDSEAESEE